MNKKVIDYRKKRDKRQAESFRSYGEVRRRIKANVRKMKAMEKSFNW